MEVINYFFILFCSLFSLSVATCIKKYIDTKNFLWIAGAYFSQISLITLYYYLFQKESFETVFVIIKVLSAILAVPITIFLFDSKLKYRHLLGFLFGGFAIYCLR
jgi:hypothetical protein